MKLELKTAVLSLIIKNRIVFGFENLVKEMRREGRKFDNKLLYSILSELHYDGAIGILVQYKKRIFFYKDVKARFRGRGNKYIYYIPTSDTIFHLSILFPDLKSKLMMKPINNNRCPLCNADVSPIEVDGERVCPKCGYVYNSEI